MLAEIVRFEGVELVVHPSENHGYTMDTETVAIGYGCKENNIRMHQLRHADELIEGKHFVVSTRVTNSDAREDEEIRPQNKHLVTEKIYWTRRGIVRLGFFIRSERAKKFRDWAEDLIINGGLKLASDNDRLKLVNDFLKSISTLMGCMQLSKIEKLTLLNTYSRRELGYGVDDTSGSSAVMRSIMPSDEDFIYLLDNAHDEMLRLVEGTADYEKARSELRSRKLSQQMMITLFRRFIGDDKLSSKAVMLRIRQAAKRPIEMNPCNGAKYYFLQR